VPGRVDRRSLVVEAICDKDTWFDHLFAGILGSPNDINVLHQSPMYMEVITGKWPPRDFALYGHGQSWMPC